MSLSLLLEKYDVSTEEGLQKALSEVEKEESEVDEALSGVLSRACMLEDKLRTASQAYTKLSEVKADAQVAADMVDRTAELARDVSAKVRQLDLARSRVAECQRRVHDLIDLQLCSAGVEAAIKANDYETGAGHVSRFLSMDPGSVAAARARGAADPRDAMTRAANTLREHIVRRFEDAAQKNDDENVDKLFKLFPQIGRAEEGVRLLAKYLATKLGVEIRRLSVVAEGEGAVFADAITRVLEAAAAAAARAAALAALAAPGLLPAALAALQPPVCAGVRRVSGALLRAAARPASALQAEPALAELALAHSTIQLYFAFLTRRTQADAASLPEAAKQAALDAVEKLIAECDLTRTAQDILGHYLELEKFFLEESVNKALKMATPQPGSTTSSLVDDVFFIARKVIRRSISTGSVEGACVVLNEVSAVLERDVTAVLRRRLRAAPPDPLPLPAPPAPRAPRLALDLTALDLTADLAHALNKDVEAQRLLFLAHLAEAEAGAEWAARLAEEAVRGAGGAARGPTDTHKVESCAAGLGAAAAALALAAEQGVAAVRAGLAPRLALWADALVQPAPLAEELEDDADAFPQALEQFSECARQHLPQHTVDALLLAVVTDVATRAEARILHHHYDREGGLAAERRCRRAAGRAGGGGARERAARLAQAASLLALERPQHAADVLRSPRLPPARVRDILARRTDFKIEDIKKLKL
ncbi:conserved oligomeric Golgi complex subunit 4 [Bombyx mandarina]|uniref:Conserved oligomeric Golgi complex subunit 4 n=1 Tax=Bombyx mandarina TaxID=7092 RepID=A0A6J2KAE2_BOMMA|nr:conserved oligomeric Golgi complex subunit 4 [Bombyx mandarina]